MYVIILVLCLKYSRSVYLSFEWNMNLFLIVKLSWSVITCKGVSPQVVSGLIHTLRPLLIACSPRGFPCHLTRAYMQYICGAQLCQELISARSRSHQHVLMGWLLVVHPSCIHLWTSYRLIGVSQNPILGQSQPTIYLDLCIGYCSINNKIENHVLGWNSELSPWEEQCVHKSKVPGKMLHHAPHPVMQESLGF